jgi:hypothetical protein
MSKPRPISDLVPGLTKDILGRQGQLFGKMLAEWSHIAGADIAAKTLPLDLKYAKKPGAKAPNMKSGRKAPDKKSQATLHLAVQSAYALELSYQKSLLIERLNMFFGYPAIKDIKMVQQDNIMNNKKRTPAPKRLLTMQEEKALDEMVGGIQENDLQIALKNLGKALSTRKNAKD